MSATDALAELERRVTEKYIAAAQTRQQPDLPDLIDIQPWLDGQPPLVPPPLQFPRQQWVTVPDRRATALGTVDRLLDLELNDKSWQTISLLMIFGGRERIA